MISPSISRERLAQQRKRSKSRASTLGSIFEEDAQTRKCCHGGYVSFVGLLFTVALGMLWTYGNTMPYIASYLAFHSVSKGKAVTSSDYDHYTAITNWSFFLIFMSLTFGVILGGKLEIYAGPRVAIAVSAVFLLCGFGGTAFALAINSVFLTLLLYGAFFGFGVGLGYPIMTIVAMRWFPDYHGRVCGIISAVFGGSPLLWDFVQTALINPTNQPMDDKMGYVLLPSVIKRVPWMFAIVGSTQMVMVAVSLICVRNPPWYVPEKDADKDNVDVAEEQLLYEADSLSLRQTLHTFTFWSLWINNFIYSYVLMFVAAEWKEFAMSHLKISNDHYLAIIGSVGSLFNGFGRLGWGLVYDYNSSFNITMGAQTAVVGVFLGTAALLKLIADNVDFLNIQVLFALWMCVIWGSVGCQYGFLPSCVAQTFGVKYTGSILGLFIWCEAPTSLMVVMATQYHKDIFGSWFLYIVFMGACSLVSTFLSVIYKSDLDRKAIIAKDDVQQSLIKQILNDDGLEYDRPEDEDGGGSLASGAVQSGNTKQRTNSQDSGQMWINASNSGVNTRGGTGIREFKAGTPPTNKHHSRISTT